MLIAVIQIFILINHQNHVSLVLSITTNACKNVPQKRLQIISSAKTAIRHAQNVKEQLQQIVFLASVITFYGKIIHASSSVLLINVLQMVNVLPAQILMMEILPQILLLQMKHICQFLNLSVINFNYKRNNDVYNIL